jgi:bifunctional non-homologous end joining protein LigD
VTTAIDSPATTKILTVVVGGWTEPQGSRPFFKGLLLGVEDEDGELRYVGHATAGFKDAEIGQVWKRLHALKTRTCPFSSVPRTTERAHWVKPALTVRVKFSGMTSDGKLRHPTYAGIGDEK